MLENSQWLVLPDFTTHTKKIVKIAMQVVILEFL